MMSEKTRMAVGRIYGAARLSGDFALVDAANEVLTKAAPSRGAFERVRSALMLVGHLHPEGGWWDSVEEVGEHLFDFRQVVATASR